MKQVMSLGYQKPFSDKDKVQMALFFCEGCKRLVVKPTNVGHTAKACSRECTMAIRRGKLADTMMLYGIDTEITAEEINRVKRIYQNMKQRCYNPSHSSYNAYGGRGIKISQEWLADVDNFLKDMLPTYFEGATIDRINNDKGYSKDNCRWVDSRTNSGNTRKSRPVVIFNSSDKSIIGESPSITAAARELKLDPSHLTKKLNNPDKALSLYPEYIIELANKNT